MTVKLLTKHHLEFLSLKRGSTDSSVTTLVKMLHCWKSLVAAHMFSLKKMRFFACTLNLSPVLIRYYKCFLFRGDNIHRGSNTSPHVLFHLLHDSSSSKGRPAAQRSR